MTKKELLKRYIFFIMGLYVCSFGIAFITKASLGTSPISSIPYTLSLGFAPTLGDFTLYMSVILIIIQLILTGKEFPKQYFLQIPMSFVFSYFIDVNMTFLGAMNPQAYPLKIGALLVGCAILGTGVCMEVIADVVMLPGESIVNVVSKKFNLDFGKTKVAFDCSMTATSIVLGIIFYQKLAGVREGTVVAAVLVGTIARFLKRKFGFIEEKFLMDETGRIAKAKKKGEAVPEDNKDRVVITVSREYGSGGRTIAKKIADELGLNYHNNDILQMAAKKTGLTEGVVAQEEQKMTNRFLFDMMAQVYDTTEQRTLQDNLNAAENEIIKGFAQKGNCVIVGRCADTLCQHVGKTFHIFLYADEKHKINAIMEREDVDYDTAKKHVKDINHKRANHYKYYTNKTWGEASNYDLCVDTSTMGAEAIVEMVKLWMNKVK